jgi:alpha-beta hydrolase superfamily lysophospholipase
MQAELPPFSRAAVGKTPLVSAFYEECYERVPGATHQAGYIEAAGYRVALHLFSPQGEPRGSVVATHGYLAHTLQLGSLITESLRQGYRVLALELPGHALSGGERGGIEAFADYGTILSEALEAGEDRLPEPWHAVGHSTGSSTILIHLAEHGDPFEKVVFLAPLIKSKYYGLSRFGRFVTRPFLSDVSTGYDEVLGVARMPLSWFDAQVRWNNRNDEYPLFDRPLLVLQGDEDRVVAWRRNRRYLERHFSNMEYHLLEDAGHVILKERPDILNEALETIMRFLEG